jgi:hypothetical protein
MAKKWYLSCEYVQIQLMFNLEKTQRDIKRMLMNIKRK